MLCKFVVVWGLAVAVCGVPSSVSGEDPKPLIPTAIELRSEQCGDGWTRWDAIGNVEGVVAHRERITALVGSGSEIWVGTSYGRLLTRHEDRYEEAREKQEMELHRCPWAKGDNYIQYHDTEWGVPIHDDRLLFEFLVLEGAQAGLSWSTILNKRDNYRQAFDDFDPAVVAKYGDKKRQMLLSNPGIVRNRLKIDSAIRNAQAFLATVQEFGKFGPYIWSFVGRQPKQNAWKSMQEVPARTPESDAMSADLKRRGFKFVGSTICYAYMQAAGMVNDHVVECFRHGELVKAARKRHGKTGR